LWLGLWTAAPAQAALRALLVGVSDYPTLGEQYRLAGPRNDVQRMAQILAQRGFAADDVLTLADGVPGALVPTRDHILKGLRWLEQTAAPGDTLLVYFAGHGSQQPADKNTPEGREEADGLHEIFLPQDVGLWQAGPQGWGVKNAIVDHELRASVDRMQARGAFVWGIFDACHSATLVRSAPDAREVRYRHVVPADLGISAAAWDAAAGDVARSRGLAPVSEERVGAGPGGSVFFYAAQSTELAPELRLPLGDPNRRPYGLFGFMVMQALSSGQAMSYRQMSQYILARYGAINEVRVTPLFTGTRLDAPVLGQSAPPVQQWPVQVQRGRWQVAVGTLSGLVPGSVLALLGGPLEPASAALGYVQVSEADGVSARLAPLAYAERPAPDLKGLATGAFARLVSNPLVYRLRVAVDSQACGERCPAAQALAQVRREGVVGADLQWLPAQAQAASEAASEADVLLRLYPDRVVFLPPSLRDKVGCGRGVADCTQQQARLASGFKTDVPAAQLPGQFSQSLQAVARYTNLLRLATQLMGDTGQSLALEIMHKPQGETAGQQRVTPERVPVLRAGDSLDIQVRNNGAVAQDLTVLYADANYGIDVLFPAGAGASNRLEPQAATTFTIDINDSTSGIERMMFIAVPATALGERTDLSVLAQPPLAQVNRSAGGSAQMQGFLDAAFASYQTRGAARAAPVTHALMQVYTFKVQP